MITDEIGREVHDRATRGMTLSAQDEAALKEWYAHQDKRQREALAPAAPPDELAKLRREVDGGLAQLQTVTLQIQALSAENETLKQEIGPLQQHLKKNPHVA